MATSLRDIMCNLTQENLEDIIREAGVQLYEAGWQREALEGIFNEDADEVLDALEGEISGTYEQIVEWLREAGNDDQIEVIMDALTSEEQASLLRALVDELI